MEILRSTKKDITIHCPDCLNYMKVKRAENGSYSGKGRVHLPPNSRGVARQ